MSASRGNGAPHARLAKVGAVAIAADADRRSRRVIAMSWFPEFLKLREHLANLPHQSASGVDLTFANHLSADSTKRMSNPKLHRNLYLLVVQHSQKCLPRRDANVG